VGGGGRAGPSGTTHMGRGILGAARNAGGPGGPFLARPGELEAGGPESFPPAAKGGYSVGAPGGGTVGVGAVGTRSEKRPSLGGDGCFFLGRNQRVPGVVQA